MTCLLPCTTHNPTPFSPSRLFLSPRSRLSLSLTFSLALSPPPLPATNQPTNHPSPPPPPTSLLLPLPSLSLSSLPFSVGSVRIGWAVWDSVPNRWALCVLAQTQSMVREGKWRGREKERDRVGEKEGEKRSCTRVCQRSCTLFQHWFGPLVFFVFFPSSSPLSAPPFSSSLYPSPWVLCRSYRTEPIAHAALPSFFFFYFVFHQDLFFFSTYFCKQTKRLVQVFDSFILLLRQYLFYFGFARSAL